MGTIGLILCEHPGNKRLIVPNKRSRKPNGQL